MKYIRLFENIESPKCYDYIIYIPSSLSLSARPGVGKYTKMIGKIKTVYPGWYVADFNKDGVTNTIPIYYPKDIVYWSKNKEDCVEILNNIDAYLDSKKYNL